MGVLDFLKTQVLEVIEWVDDSRDTLSFRFPDDDKARDLPGAHVVDLLFHAFAGMLGSGNEVYLILFDGPAGDVGGCVVGKLVSREGFDL